MGTAGPLMCEGEGLGLHGLSVRQGLGLGVPEEPVTFLGLRIPGCCRGRVVNSASGPLGNSGLRELESGPASGQSTSSQRPNASGPGPARQPFLPPPKPRGSRRSPDPSVPNRGRAPGVGEGVQESLANPSARRPRVPARPQPRPPPAGLGQGDAYLADQAVQVGLGPAHSHHLCTRRVQRLDSAAPDACKERGSVRAPLPGRPLPGPPLAAAPGPPLPAPVTSARRPAKLNSMRFRPALRTAEAQLRAWVQLRATVREGARRGGTRRANRRAVSWGGREYSNSGFPTGAIGRKEWARPGRGRRGPRWTLGWGFSNCPVVTLRPGVK